MNIEALQAQLLNLQKTNPLEFAILMLVLLFCVLGQLRYYLTLQRTMEAVSPSLRPFSSRLIWLALIPIPGVIWYIAYILMLSLALKKELALRQLPGDGALGISLLTSVLLGLTMLPGLSMQVALPAMAMLIMHWIRMAGLRKLLADPVYLLVD